MNLTINRPAAISNTAQFIGVPVESHQRNIKVSGWGSKSWPNHLERRESGPNGDILATEIADDLEAALAQFTKIAARLGARD